MSVGGISSYSNYALQFQQYKTSGNASSSSSSSSRSTSAIGNAFANSSLIDQLTSSIQMAMNTLGLKAGDRITFNTLNEARQKMEDSFAAQVKKDLQALGVDENAKFNLVSDGNGGIRVIMDEGTSTSVKNYTESDSLDDLLKKLGFDDDVKFSLKSDGKGGFEVIADGTATKTASFKNLDTLKTMMEELGLDEDEDAKFSLEADGEGGFKVVTDDEDLKAMIEDYLDENPEARENLLKDIGLGDDKAFTLAYDGKGGAKVTTEEDIKSSIEQYFKDNPDEAEKILKEFNLTKSSDFTIAHEGEDSIKVTASYSGKEMKAIIEQYLKDNPKMVDKFNEIQSLTNLEQARKAQALDPSTIRKRVQMESLVAWFAGEGMSVDQMFQNSGSTNSWAMSGLNYTV